MADQYEQERPHILKSFYELRNFCADVGANVAVLRDLLVAKGVFSRKEFDEYLSEKLASNAEVLTLEALKSFEGPEQ